MKSFFCILNKEFPKLGDIGLIIEENLIKDSSKAIIQSRIFAERIISEVINKEEGQAYLTSYTQNDRLKILSKEGIIDYTLIKCFNDIRITGNKVAHGEIESGPSESLRLHKKLYVIVKWFYETYGKDYSKELSIYKLPDFNESKREIDLAEIDSIIKMRLENYVKDVEKKYKAEETGIERNLNRSKEEVDIDEKVMKVLGFEYKDEILREEKDEIKEIIDIKKINETDTSNKEEYIYQKLNGSYLLNEISKLSTSSQEAVESCENMSVFKKYLHVERSIQGEFVNLLEEAKVSNDAELVILCGSVGDGKSHMLSYVNENYNTSSIFEIHNDATESFDPEKTEIETLEEVLRDFSDDNLHKTKRKQILAINLGVLNNFLAEDTLKDSYCKLRDFIDKSGVFNQENVEQGCSEKYFKLISFGNYNIFELNEEGYKSEYIENIMSKIVDKSDNNPFYNAYNKDKKEGIVSPLITNYEILGLPGAIEKISNLVVQVMVKNKKIVGTRELLNFTYEILVPANIEKFKMDSSHLDIINVLLPNLLFNSIERGEILRLISEEDILNIRSLELDELLIKLNIASDIRSILEQYIDSDKRAVLNLILGDMRNINTLAERLKVDLIAIVLRSLFIIGNDKIFKLFIEKNFEQFMKYLYFFNTGDLKRYKELFNEVKLAIFKWSDTPKENYIYLCSKLNNFKIAEHLELKLSKKGALMSREDEVLERFKTNINIAFEVKNRGVEIIEIDYQLYKKICDINQGYCASKHDKEQSVIFLEFIDKLLLLGSLDSELIIEDRRDKKCFKLIFEDVDFEGEKLKFERLK